MDIIFYPTPLQMYQPDHTVYVVENHLAAGLCGSSRPIHFRGVLTVVAKLFNLVQPDLSVFGEKDAQQLRVIERMVRDLNIPVKIVRGPIVREPDGLAMSSRNKYLKAAQRDQALCLRRALDLAESMARCGERRAAVVRTAMEQLITSMPDATVDYIAFVDDETLVPVEALRGALLVALAVRIGSTRLIDNTVFKV